MPRLSIHVLHRSAPRPSSRPACSRRSRALLTEAWLYLSGSPRSRLHQHQALRALDDRLRRDIDLPGRAPPLAVERWPGLGW